MIAVSEKYALPVSAPMPITSQHQHQEYLSVLDALAGKDRPTGEEEKYAEVLMTLIEAYEEEHHPIPDASAVDVLRTLMEAHDLRQKDLGPHFWIGKYRLRSLAQKTRPPQRPHRKIKQTLRRFSHRIFPQIRVASRGAELPRGWRAHVMGVPLPALRPLALKVFTAAGMKGRCRMSGRVATWDSGAGACYPR